MWNLLISLDQHDCGAGRVEQFVSNEYRLDFNKFIYSRRWGIFPGGVCTRSPVRVLQGTSRDIKTTFKDEELPRVNNQCASVQNTYRYQMVSFIIETEELE